MKVIRKPAVAGLFYPNDPAELRAQINGYLANPSTTDQAPKALIVPHAGYSYSGQTAGTAYKDLFQIKHLIKRVVLLGPAHRVGFRGIAFCSSDTFNTPLGDIDIDHSAFAAISEIPGVLLLDQAHAEEHSLEVQLPFLQTTLDDFKLVPLVVGDADRFTVANVIEKLWGNNETLFVISSDLSHFHNYESANALDKKTCEAIEHFNPEQIGFEQACGRNPVNGLLEVAKRKWMSVSTLALCNSGDTAGDKDRVVGYGAWAFYHSAA